ncbi:MAG: hypothetical protein WCV50_01460 [Patescibacteria group bacterium]|jgi:hypothetical protein
MQIKKKNQNELYTNTTQLVSYCPLCNCSFSPTRAAIVCDEGHTQLLYVNCSQCRSSIVLLLIMGEVGVSSIGLITDLREPEVKIFKDTAPVSQNDIIDLHQLLTGKENFITLLS